MTLDPRWLVQLHRVARAARLRPRRATLGAVGRRPTRGDSGRQPFASAGQYLRDYAPGDDYRAIDWRLCARHDELRVPVSPQRPIRSIAFLVDASASMTVGPRPKAHVAEQTVALLGAMALALAAPGDAAGGETLRLSAATYAERLLRRSPPLDDLRRWAAWLAANGGPTPPARGDCERAAREFLQTTPLPGDVWLVTDAFECDQLVAGLSRLVGRGCRTHLVHVVDPADAAPDLAGDVELVDVESGRRWTTTVTPRDLALLRREYDAWLAEIDTACRRLRVDVHRVSVAADFAALVRIAEDSGIA